ncbi:unnamed protein product [Macrosiphum euphorbiae]|uniref:Transposase n=1 Tax=Macrosiphum euphorbiae TaxID=13131 RepID=A0AAV0XMT7_9HEMI|nr:unnamed protein product [Macrosiphum euphorbiae]
MARNEKLAENDLHWDDVADLILRCRRERDICSPDDIYVHQASDPIGCLFFSVQHFNSIQSVIDKSSLVLHLDATGSVVRKINAKGKRVYYYAGVVNIDSKLIPLLNFVSSEHNIAAISCYLMRFKQSFGQKWPIFRTVVLDFSMALLSAVCESWNKLSLIDYINNCYKYCKSDEPNQQFIVILLCGSHFQHMISRCVKSITKSKKIHDFILDCTALLIISTNLNSIRTTIRLMFNILLNRKKTLCCAHSMNALSDQCHSVKAKEPTSNDYVSDDEAKFIYGNSSNFKEKSMFYVDFEKMYRTVSDTCKITDNCELLPNNEYYCELFAKNFLNLYLPFTCMWTRLMMPQEVMSKYSVKTVTNGNVEKHFDNVKNSLMKGETNMKLGRFVNKIQIYTEAVCKEIKDKIPRVLYKRKKNQIQIPFRHFLTDHNYALLSSQFNKKCKQSSSEWDDGKTFYPGINDQK